MNRRPVSATYRVVEENPGHTTIAVFIGRNPGARGHSGQLILRTDEYNELFYDGQLMLALDPQPTATPRGDADG